MERTDDESEEGNGWWIDVMDGAWSWGKLGWALVRERWS
jgi:hypothetical protein